MLDELRDLGINVNEFAYDDRGNLVLHVGPGPAGGHRLFTEVEYDETWNVPLQEMSYDGFYAPAELLTLTLYTLDEGTGAVATVRRVLGENDLESEETDDAVETFTYTAAPSISGDPPAGLLASHTNANGVTTLYDYNERGLVIEITLAEGTSDEAVLAFEYNSLDQLEAEIDALGRRTEHTYDALNNRLTTLSEDPDDAGPLESSLHTWEYNAMGSPILYIDPLGRETEYVYGAFGNLVEQTLSGTGFDPITVTWGYDDAGRNTSFTDALGRVTTLTLDSLGRTLATTLPDPDGPGEGNPLASPVFSQTYHPLGYVDSTTDALGNVTTVEMSDFGRTITTTLPDPDGAGELNPLAAPVYITRLNLLGQVAEEVDPLGRSTFYSHDMLGRTVQRVAPDPDGAGELEAPLFSWTHDAIGNVLTETDALGNTSVYVWDFLDRLVEKQLPDPDGEGPLEIPSILYVWDDVGNMLSLTDPVGNTTSWVCLIEV